MHPERQAFEAAIQEDPYDAALRNIYADWLEDYDEPEAADWQRSWTPERQRAEEWLRGLAGQCELSYEALLGVLAEYAETGDWYTLRFDTPDDCRDTERLWECYRLVTGRAVPPERADGVPFSCAC